MIRCNIVNALDKIQTVCDPKPSSYTILILQGQNNIKHQWPSKQDIRHVG